MSQFSPVEVSRPMRVGSTSSGLSVHRDFRTATLLLCIALASGCGTGLFGPRIYGGGAGERPEMPASPLPPLELDTKLVKPKEVALYGRVVIDGKPAKKNSLTVVAVSMDALKETGDVTPYLPGTITQKQKFKKKSYKPVSSAVLRDDGFYLIRGLRQGEYKLFCQFGPSFKGKEKQIARYDSVIVTPLGVDVDREQPTMQDIVLEIDTAPPTE